MNIYVGHSNNLDFINNIYEPIKNSHLSKIHNFFFPHEQVNKLIKTKDIIKNTDLIIADVSLSSTGLGIELGWANDMQKPILCIYQNDFKYSSSLKFITNNFISYENSEDLIIKLTHFISNKNNN